MASNHKLSEPHQENLMQLHDTVACLTRSGLLANSIRYQSASSSDDLETDLGTSSKQSVAASLSARPLHGLTPENSRSSWRRAHLDWLISAREAICRWTFVKFC